MGEVHQKLRCRQGTMTIDPPSVLHMNHHKTQQSTDPKETVNVTWSTTQEEESV